MNGTWDSGDHFDFNTGAYEPASYTVHPQPSGVVRVEPLPLREVVLSVYPCCSDRQRFLWDASARHGGRLHPLRESSYRDGMLPNYPEVLYASAEEARDAATAWLARMLLLGRLVIPVERVCAASLAREVDTGVSAPAQDIQREEHHAA